MPEPATTIESATEHAESRATDRRQLFAAIVLGLAAVLTALSSFSSSVAGGDAANLRTDAGRTLADANFFFSQANQVEAGDQVLFVAYAQANQQDDEDLQTFLLGAMRPVMQDAITWWAENDDAVTPFDEVEGNPYVLEDLDTANARQDEADAQVAKAEAADHKATQFDLATVLLALTLFFAGVATLFRRRVVTWLLLGVSVASLGCGAGLLLTNLPA